MDIWGLMRASSSPTQQLYRRFEVTKAVAAAVSLPISLGLLIPEDQGQMYMYIFADTTESFGTDSSAAGCDQTCGGMDRTRPCQRTSV